MQLHKLTLNNIRSYDTETVTFPDSITLLSGAIGSGKTSVLLGVEFALFGFIRGSFSGSSLLRHGTDRGSVTLSFTIADDKVTVHRELKRSSRGVRQDTGWYEVNGDREEATAREIKAKVIEVLGYPSSLVTKSKSMLYRYTVYTPQEAMKNILRESADDRLEKIRKVLRLDKYRRVKDNMKTYARELRRNIRNDEDQLDDRADIVEDIEAYDDKLSTLSEKQSSYQEKKERLLETIEDVNDRLDTYEEEREELRSLRQQYETVSDQISTVSEDYKTIKANRAKKEKRAEKDLEEPEEPGVAKETVEETRSDLEDRLDELREMKTKLNSKEELFDAKKEEAEDLQERISDLDTCPTCGQSVDEEHAQTVIANQNDRIESIEEKQVEVQEKQEAVKENIAEVKERREEAKTKLEAWRTYEKKQGRYEERKKRQDEYKDEVETLKSREEEKQEQLDTLQDKKASLASKLEEDDDVQETIDDLQDKKEELTQQHDDVTSTIARCDERLETTRERRDEAQERLDAHDEAVESIQQRRTTHTWITEHFTNLLDVIEQHVLLTVHQRFDETFRSFFNDLIEDENILADIDNEFTPRVTQRGYTMDIEDLSGGEKTSVALAYRFAMNEVINEYMDDIKTDDIIVLDEPTDGFSGEQLDRLRDILNGLQASQIILVSHEEKLEGVTEHLIEVRKTNNTSAVVN